ncbi:hypothetical protein HK100_005409 [Physocladia obscura]|uniref:Uncharacterized protein n=1 Tax=Physocladia obscura TaxID=109957 RepID=A0AAD5XJA6_9FUNG|nr:hypothetical protein HK100_005409 [Physocladia obscura]
MASFTVKKDSARDLTSTSFDNDIFYEANGYPDAVKFDGPPTIGATKQEVDSEDEEQNEINSVETLVERLNKEMEHRGPQSKAKPRKKGIDADNELEIVSRKLLNVAFDENAAANAIPQEKYLSPNDPSTIKYLVSRIFHLNLFLFLDA